MRNLLGKASAAQNLDGGRLKGSLLRPLKASVVRLNPSGKGSPTALGNQQRYFAELLKRVELVRVCIPVTERAVRI